MTYLGDFISGTTLYHLWNSNNSLGASVTRATNGTVYIYKDLTTSSETTVGVTDTEDFDSVTGIHAVTVNTTNAFYAKGSEYHAVLKSSTIDGQTVSGYLFAFSIENRSTHPKTHYPSNFSLAVIDSSGIVDADVRQWLGTAAATPTVNGVPEVDVTHWLGTAAATPTTAGVPEVDITHIAGAAVNTSSAQLGVNVVNAAGTAWGSGAVTAASLAADAAAEIADAVWDEDATGHQTQGTFGQAIGDPTSDSNTIYAAVVTGAAGATIAADIVDIEEKVDDLESRLGTPSDLGSGATVAANLVDIEGQTDDIGAAGAGLTSIPNSAGVTTLLTRVGTPSDLGSGATVAANLVDIEGQTDDIGAAGAGLTALATAAELAKVPKSDSNVTWNATAAAQIQSEVDDALVAQKLDHLVAVADADDAVDNSIVAKLASKNATADWSSYVNTTDSLEAIRDRGDAAWTTGTAPSAADVADAVWDEATSGHTASGTFGEQAKTDIDAILADTGTDGVVVASASKTGYALASTGLDSVVGAEPSSVPAFTASLPTILSWILAFFRDKRTNDGATETLYKDDGSTTLATSTITKTSSSVTKGEWG